MADTTQYLIDIAVQADGVDDAASNLARMTEEMYGVDSAAGVLDAAAAKMRSSLEDAAAAVETTNTKLAEAEAAYKQNETGADRAAKAAERLAQQLLKAQEAQTKIANSGDAVNIAKYQRAAAKVADLSEKQSAAAAKAAQLASALAQEGSALDALRADADAAAKAHDKLERAQEKLVDAKGISEAGAAARRGSGDLLEAADGLSQLGGGLGDVAGKVSETGQGLRALAGSLGTAGAAAAAAAAAVVLVGVAVVALTVKATIAATKLADLGRSAKLTNAALEAQYAELKGLDTLLPNVASSTGLAEDKLRDLAKQLAEGGVKASDMPDALRAVALAEAALGDGGAAKLIEDLKAGKKSAAELAAEMQSKFGPIVEKKLNSLSSLSDRFQANIGKLFADINIEPLLKGMGKLVDLFDANSTTGRALKTIVEQIFNRLTNFSPDAVAKLESLMLGAEIAALHVIIALNRIDKAVTKIGGNDAFDKLISVMTAANNAAAFLGLTTEGTGAKMGASMDNAATVTASKGELIAAVGDAIIAGLEQKIASGASAVASAMSNTVDAAITAAKSKLGIASPSKVMASIADNTIEGFAGPIEGGAKRAQTALESLVEPPAAKQGGPGKAGGSSGGNTFHLHIHGVRDVRDFEAKVPGILTRILEGDLTMLTGGQGQPALEGT